MGSPYLRSISGGNPLVQPEGDQGQNPLLQPDRPDAAVPQAQQVWPAGQTPDRSNPQALPFVPFDKTTQTGSQYIASLLPQAAAMVLPPGYTAVPTSGDRPHAIAGDTGQPSMHSFGGAQDWAILDPRGNPVPGGLGKADTTGYYRNMAVAMYQIADPDIQPWMDWGGRFSKTDPIHLDVGGVRGAVGPTLAQMLAQQTGGR
jgi:hypothetical protein